MIVRGHSLIYWGALIDQLVVFLSISISYRATRPMGLSLAVAQSCKMDLDDDDDDDDDTSQCVHSKGYQ